MVARARRPRSAVREAFTWRADYEGGRCASSSREHARGTSQLTELASRGPYAARAATSGAGPPSREALRRGLAVALAEAEIGGARRERLPHCPDAIEGIFADAHRKLLTCPVKATTTRVARAGTS